MCIILFAWQLHSQYPLVVLANRDEFHDRPALPIHFWDDNPGIIAGRDLSAGGTWLGATKAGRFAALTNYRDFRLPVLEGAPSRGELVTGFLNSPDPDVWLAKLEQDAARYAGFNLLASDGNHLWHYSNHGGAVKEVKPGLHGLSNHLLDTPWPKVTKGVTGLQTHLGSGVSETSLFFDLLTDTEQGPDHLLPDTGRDIDFERRVSPIFLRDDVYGTRCSSVYLSGADGQRHLLERSYDRGGNMTVEKQLTF